MERAIGVEIAVAIQAGDAAMLFDGFSVLGLIEFFLRKRGQQ